MGIRKCVDCGDSFYAEENWKIRCIPCWRGFKGIEASVGAGHLAVLSELRAELSRREEALEQREADLEQWEAGLSSMLNKLLQLCYPDKHNGSQLATSVTQWLLQQR